MNARFPLPVVARRLEDYYAQVLVGAPRGGPSYDEARRDFQSTTLPRRPR